MSLHAILYHRISSPVAFATVGLCAGFLAAAVWGSWCLDRLLVDRDTPEICQIYLEQDAFVVQHFGRLRQERFQANESCAFLDGEHGGCTEGVYTYAITGSRAEGVVKLAWIRERGFNGSLSVPYLQIVEHRATTGLQPAAAFPHAPAAAPRSGLISSGPLRLRDAA